MTPSPDFDISFAYQPIVDIDSASVFAYEALVRGPANQPAGAVFETIAPSRLHDFDRAARTRAIRLAASLGLDTSISLNLMPHALDKLPDSVSSTLDAARAVGLPAHRIILEVTESELIRDFASFASTINQYRATGVRFAIDDFGAGYSGLNLLADFQPDVIKLDMHLIRDIDRKGPRQAIVRAVIQACVDLGIDVIAEGVETEVEYRWFKRAGINLFQGYFFARPGFESLPAAVFTA